MLTNEPYCKVLPTYLPDSSLTEESTNPNQSQPNYTVGVE